MAKGANPMLWNDNIQFLESEYPNIRKDLIVLEQQMKDVIRVPLVTRSGLPSLLLEHDGKVVCLHSKYDPIHEATQWMVQYEEDVIENEHIFFYGIGFAYHIEYLLTKYPDKFFTLYEPNPSIFYAYLIHRAMNTMPLIKLKNLYVEFDPESVTTNLTRFLHGCHEKFVVITHPVYERVFEQQTKQFSFLFKSLLFEKREEKNFVLDIQHIWTINTTLNFIKVLKTPNILRIKKNFFEGKPVIIVSAGPSLIEEIEHLRIIKEKKLAYIFAVGSANKVLLTEGIYPDAITSFDPYDHNTLVFDEIINKEINTIPLIFGTTIGCRSVEIYPGPKLHMVMEQDFISAYYLQYEQLAAKNEIMQMAPNIAVVSLNLLHKLGCKLVILVGQNFAFRNDKYYSEGISFDYRKDNELSLLEKTDLEYVESVEGKQIATMKGFTQSRLSMEQLIKQTNISVINTTRGGAKIAGTQYIELGDVITEKLRASIVEDDWYVADPTEYNKEDIYKQTVKMEKSHSHIRELLNKFDQIFEKINKQMTLNKTKPIDSIKKLNNEIFSFMQELENNSYYLTCLRLQVHQELDLLQSELRSISLSQPPMKIIQANVGAYKPFIDSVRHEFKKSENLFVGFHKYIFNYLNESHSNS